jgi:hypothetical protein
MADTTTTNYGWVKPDIAASDNTWGNKLNTDLDGIDSTVKGVSNAVPLASTTLPTMAGTAAAGSAATFARGDHVHPVDTSRYAASNPSNFQTAAQVTASLGGYLPLAGGTLTGRVNGTTMGLSGTGISYSSLTGGNSIGWGWNNSQAILFVDGSSQGAIAFNSTFANYLPLTGGSLTGNLNARYTQIYNPTGDDPLNLVADQTHYCRFRATVTNVRTWSCGVFPSDGSFNIGDETGAAVRVTIDTNGGFHVNSGGIFAPASGAGCYLYGNSGPYSDGNNFIVGESGIATDGTAWRYLFQRSTGTRFWFNYAGTALMQLPGTGNLTITGTLSQASDASLKREIEEAGIGLAELKQIIPKHYRRIHPEPPPDQPGWKPEDRRELGFVAQDVQAAIPDAVIERDDGMLAIELTPLIAALTNAVKELDARLARIEGRQA